MEASTVTEMLAERTAEELAEMATRLERSKGCLEEALVELQAEQQELNDEQAHLNSTIDFMMKELRKLNIGSDNLVEPRLEGEGPVEYVARLWEKMRPRELAIAVSENIGGDIQVGKPTEGSSAFEESPAAQRLKQQFTEGWSQLSQATKDLIPAGQEGMDAKELGKQVAERSQEIGKQLQDRFAGFYSDMRQAAAADDENALGQKLAKKGQKLGKKVEAKLSGALSFLSQAQSEQQGERSPGMASLFAYLRDPSTRPETGPDSAGPGEDDEVPEAPAAAAKGAEKDAAEPSSSSTSAGSEMSANSAGVSREASDEQLADSSLATAAAEPAAEVPAAEAPASEEAKDEAAEEPDPAMAAALQSTILIQVQLKLGDGSIQVCEVRAEDRCKEVAQRFVKEHSLKAWFEAPLRAFLTETENNAETFPVKLEADLMEIRKQYSKKK